MNNPNPFVPKGSLLEQQSQRRSRLKLAVFCVLAVCVTGLVAMLIQGCKRENPDTQLNLPPVVDTNPPAMDMTNTAVADTNPTVPMPPAATNLPPVAPPVTPPLVETAGSEYVIVAGDTLAKIAKKNNVSVKAIEAANPGVDPKKLKIGKKLTIPASTKSADAAPTATAGAADAGGDAYVVKSGDTLSKIAKKNSVNLKALEAANPGVDPAHIKVGQKLKIPAKAETAATAPAADATAAPALPPMSAPASAPGK